MKKMLRRKKNKSKISNYNIEKIIILILMMKMMRIPFLRNETVIFSQNLTDIFNVFFIIHITLLYTL